MAYMPECACMDGENSCTHRIPGMGPRDQSLGEIPPKSAAVCPTCVNPLERTRGRSIAAALACAVATFLLLLPANLLPLMQISLLGAACAQDS
jgi:uncharacterized paraquat-inducible protein A